MAGAGSQHHPPGAAGGAAAGTGTVVTPAAAAAGPGEDSSDSEAEQEGPQKLIRKVSTSGQIRTKVRRASGSVEGGAQRAVCGKDTPPGARVAPRSQRSGKCGEPRWGQGPPEPDQGAAGRDSRAPVGGSRVDSRGSSA